MITPTRRLRLSAFAMLLVAGAMLLPTLASADSTFYVTGRGWGHGIGMSQYGAKELALRTDPLTGNRFTGAGIIRYYFGRTTRTSIDLVPTKTILVRLDNAASTSNDGYTASSWTLRPGNPGSRLLVKASNLPTAGVETSPDAWYKFSVTASGITVYQGSTQWKPGGKSTLTGTISVTEVGSASTKLVQVAEGTGHYDRTYGRYREIVQISSNGSKLKLINRLNIERYLYGVVPREMPASWGDSAPAALQAQAIAARSYAYVSSGELYCTTMSQVYQGHSYGIDRSHTTACEDSRTNAAIAATGARIARYHASDGAITNIRTYFSSTSGGYTANIEDVWTAATPQPYYRGAPDPDTSSPYHANWGSPLSYTGTVLASKLRASSRTASASEPSPAYVTSAAITRAANGSGYAVWVTFGWSNGGKHTVSGDAVRGALGLKSTKFSIGKGYVPSPPSADGLPPVPPLDRYESGDSRFSRTGPWASTSSSSFSGGSRWYTSAAQGWFVARFNGKSVRWLATKGPAYGKALVYVDGKYRKTVDLYSSTSKLKQTVFYDYALADTEHVVEIRVTGERNPSSNGSRVCVDAIDIGDGKQLLQAQPPVRVVDQDHEYLARTGRWTVSNENSESVGGWHRYANTAGAKYYLAFHGTGFDWIGTSSTGYGLAKVTIDDRAPVIIDTYTSGTQHRRTIYSNKSLPWGKHRVVIECLGQAQDGTGPNVSVDGFNVHGGVPLKARPPVKLVDDAHSAMAYTGTWVSRSVTGRYYSTEHYSAAKGARLNLRFDGNAVILRGVKRSNGGRAKVWVDGVYKTTIDTYAPGSSLKQVLFSSTDLASGTHTLTVEVLGAHSSRSSGNYVFVDAAQVWGDPVVP